MLVAYPQTPGAFHDTRDQGQPPHLFYPTGVQGGNQYQDHFGYTYAYDPGTQEFLVTAQPDGQPVVPHLYWGYYVPQQGGQQAAWLELTKITHPTIGAALYAYTATGNRRFFYQGNNYALLPGNAIWADAQGRFMNDFTPPTVLTNNGALRRKYYAVTRQGQNYIVPFKKTRELYNTVARQPFAGGLPGLLGGNMDYNETQPLQTLQRETTEESGSRYALTAITVDFLYHEATQFDDMTFYSADVTAQAGPFQNPHEMAGSFTLQAAQFTVGAHTQTIDVFSTRLLDLFNAYLGTPAAVAINNVANAPQSQAFLTQMRGLAPSANQQRALTEWNQSATRTALYQVISTEAGLVAAQRSATGAVAPVVGAIGQYANRGWSEYVAGIQAVRQSGVQAAAPVVGGGQGQVSRAHRQGWDDYVAGIQAVRQSGTQIAAPAIGGGQGQVSRAYRQAWDDYVAGIQAVQQSGAQAPAPAIGGGQGQVARAHRQAWDDYVAGIQVVSQTPLVTDQAALGTARAYKVAWTDYINGVNQVVVLPQPRAYQVARDQYDEGESESRQGSACPPGAQLAFREGHEAGGKRQKV